MLCFDAVAIDSSSGVIQDSSEIIGSLVPLFNSTVQPDGQRSSSLSKASRSKRYCWESWSISTRLMPSLVPWSDSRKERNVGMASAELCKNLELRRFGKVSNRELSFRDILIIFWFRVLTVPGIAWSQPPGWFPLQDLLWLGPAPLWSVCLHGAADEADGQSCSHSAFPAPAPTNVDTFHYVIQYLTWIHRNNKLYFLCTHQGVELTFWNILTLWKVEQYAPNK